jgi:hypothetical protein
VLARAFNFEVYSSIQAAIPENFSVQPSTRPPGGAKKIGSIPVTWAIGKFPQPHPSKKNSRCEPVGSKLRLISLCIARERTPLRL